MARDSNSNHGRWRIYWRRCWCVWLIVLAGCAADAKPILPDSAYLYRPILLRAVYAEFGTGRYVAAFGAQIHQESLWNCEARSAYAIGCTQFTPSTAQWVEETIGKDFGPARPTDPVWAIPAMTRYMRWIKDKVAYAASECDWWAFSLSAYNGGLGWVNRDRKLAKKQGYNPSKWWYNVEYTSSRAKWAFKENRGYPKRILLELNKKYVAGGFPGEILCEF
jgi:membrane-bound lytic murein transglycosylase MltF